MKTLRFVGWIEGCTLLSLLFIAVPLKHLLGYPAAVTIIGPIHGGAFVTYFCVAMWQVLMGAFNFRESIRVLIVAIIPFGTFANDSFLLARLESRARSAKSP